MKTIRTALNCMMLVSFCTFSGTLFDLITTSDAFAAYKGPTSSDFVKSDVKSALKANDNTQMALEGYILKHIGKNKYFFQDNSGSLVVEIDKEDFLEIYVDEHTFVRISGEVDKDFAAVDFDVDYLEVLDNSLHSKLQ